MHSHTNLSHLKHYPFDNNVDFGNFCLINGFLRRNGFYLCLPHKNFQANDIIHVIEPYISTLHIIHLFGSTISCRHCYHANQQQNMQHVSQYPIQNYTLNSSHCSFKSENTIDSFLTATDIYAHELFVQNIDYIIKNNTEIGWLVFNPIKQYVPCIVHSRDKYNKNLIFVSSNNVASYGLIDIHNKRLICLSNPNTSNNDPNSQFLNFLISKKNGEFVETIPKAFKPQHIHSSNARKLLILETIDSDFMRQFGIGQINNNNNNNNNNNDNNDNNNDEATHLGAVIIDINFLENYCQCVDKLTFFDSVGILGIKKSLLKQCSQIESDSKILDINIDNNTDSTYRGEQDLIGRVLKQCFDTRIHCHKKSQQLFNSQIRNWTRDIDLDIEMGGCCTKSVSSNGNNCNSDGNNNNIIKNRNREELNRLLEIATITSDFAGNVRNDDKSGITNNCLFNQLFSRIDPSLLNDEKTETETAIIADTTTTTSTSTSTILSQQAKHNFQICMIDNKFQEYQIETVNKVLLGDDSSGNLLKFKTIEQKYKSENISPEDFPPPRKRITKQLRMKLTSFANKGGNGNRNRNANANGNDNNIACEFGICQSKYEWEVPLSMGLQNNDEWEYVIFMEYTECRCDNLISSYVCTNTNDKDSIPNANKTGSLISVQVSTFFQPIVTIDNNFTTGFDFDKLTLGDNNNDDEESDSI